MGNAKRDDYMLLVFVSINGSRYTKLSYNKVIKDKKRKEKGIKF